MEGFACEADAESRPLPIWLGITIEILMSVASHLRRRRRANDALKMVVRKKAWVGYIRAT